MDSITNIEAVLSSLGNIDDCILKIDQLVGDNLFSVKNATTQAWKSEKADLFVKSYDKLSGDITSMIDSINKYKEKVNKVVEQFKAFDNSFTNNN